MKPDWSVGKKNNLLGGGRGIKSRLPENLRVFLLFGHGLLSYSRAHIFWVWVGVINGVE